MSGKWGQARKSSADWAGGLAVERACWFALAILGAAELVSPDQ